MKNSFVRFIIVGVVNTMVGLSAMYLLLHVVGLSYWLSTFLGNSIGAIVSFFLNKNFTFKSKNSAPKSALRFVIVILCCYFVSYYLGRNIVEWLLQSNDIMNAKGKTDLAVFVSTCLYTVLNYFGQKLFVFPSKKIHIKSVNPE